jgi:hypothetical protein
MKSINIASLIKPQKLADRVTSALSNQRHHNLHTWLQWLRSWLIQWRCIADSGGIADAASCSAHLQTFSSPAQQPDVGKLDGPHFLLAEESTSLVKPGRWQPSKTELLSVRMQCHNACRRFVHVMQGIIDALTMAGWTGRHSCCCEGRRTETESFPHGACRVVYASPATEVERLVTKKQQKLFKV